MNIMHRGILMTTNKFQVLVARNIHHKCKFLVVGGGTGGCTMAAKLSNKFSSPPSHVIIVEPNEFHYYQPMFTLIGGGLKNFESSRKRMIDVLPQRAQWIKDNVVTFEPGTNRVCTNSGIIIKYEIMIVAMGMQLHWNKIPGLVDNLKNPNAQVCSIYGSDTVDDVFQKIQNTQEGPSVFTFPNTPVKCPGAPQKIAYLAEDYWRQKNLRKNINVIYNTALPNIFGVKKYADALWDVCKDRDIEVNVQTVLTEIRVDRKEAIFVNLNKPNALIIQKFGLLHVCPPMGPPEVLKQTSLLTNAAGFLSVDPHTLQHTTYKNIYGIGDCTSTPNSKTMAAIASQSKVLYDNIMAKLTKKSTATIYNGYASCPLVTGRNKCILAEFDYNLKPLETFPVNQKNEYWAMFVIKKYFFPFLYWNIMLKGKWNGPELFRKIFAPLKSE